VADAVAMDASQELAFSVDQSVVERAKANAAQQLAKLKGDRPQGTIVVTPTIQFDAKGDPEGMHVAITATRKSFFGNMLPPGGFVTTSRPPPCAWARRRCAVLGTSRTATQTLHSYNTARLTAGKCLVHSGHEMIVTSSNPIESKAAEAVTRASGNIQPAALVGAEPIADPFASMNLWPTTAGCLTGEAEFYDSGVTFLKAGVHCKKVTATKNATLVLLSGDHYFVKGGLEVKDNAIVRGEDVVLIYDKDSTVWFDGAALVDLTGRKTGQFAGFVMVATRDNASNFRVAAANVVNLHGTLYIPGGQLHVFGHGKVAHQSAWTVVVARELKLYGTTDLVINANYRGSPVPVPKGVGNKALDKTKNARLKR
jgi:hypothetical protein